jgi:cellobiose-specific phosphotransferase system component IIA
MTVMTTVRSQTYPISNVIFIALFAVSGLITIPTFGFASSSSSGADQGAANMHLDETMKALQAGDTAGAEMHMIEADKVLEEGEAKTHLDEAIKALQAGDTAGAEMHAQLAQDSL